jgi:uncharacterized OsmC-like protein
VLLAAAKRLCTVSNTLAAGARVETTLSTDG